MTTITINVSQAKGQVLDWLVAKCEDVVLLDPHNNKWELCWTLLGDNSGDYYSPTTNWSQGGPLFSEERIESYWHPALECWAAIHNGNLCCGPTELIAKARCLVVSKLDDEVDVPEELA